MEVLVEYDYDALHDDELTLRPGDIIKNVRYIEEEGWMEGDLNGKRGLFPDNFVKEVKKESKVAKETRSEPKEEIASAPKREKSPGNVASLVQRISTIGIPTGGFQPQPPAAAKKPKKRQCKVMFEYQPLNEDELELKVGDIIDIIEEVEEGWWSGNHDGKSGLFPSNFVKEVEEAGPNDMAADESNGGGMDGTGTTASPQPTSGNGVVMQHKKIRGVGFGDIFKEGSVKLKSRLPSPDTEDTKEKPIPSLPSAAKPAHPSMTDLQRADGDGKPEGKEYFKVTFAFVASKVDELDLKEDDIIHILTKDTGEPGWWRGAIGGREGVFPENFVIMHDMEKETPTSRGSVKSSLKQESDEKPKKPPPPSKSSIAFKPDFPSADKKPDPMRPQDRVKPAAPLVPPKKHVPPIGKVRPGSIPPKRPDKPLVPSPIFKHNGEVPSTRPKSDQEPSVPSKPKTLSGDWGEKTSDVDLMSFDELSSPLDKLSHLTANRPKMPGRRLPAKFGGGQSSSNEVNVEKTFKADDEDSTKPKPPESKKPATKTLSPSPSLHKTTTAAPEAKSNTGVAVPNSDGASQGDKARHDPGETNSQLEELRSQMKELLLSVELLKAQQTREMAELRGELDEERLKRLALQTEIEKLKRSVHST